MALDVERRRRVVAVVLVCDGCDQPNRVLWGDEASERLLCPTCKATEDMRAELRRLPAPGECSACFFYQHHACEFRASCTCERCYPGRVESA